MLWKMTTDLEGLSPNESNIVAEYIRIKSRKEAALLVSSIFKVGCSLGALAGVSVSEGDIGTIVSSLAVIPVGYFIGDAFERAADLPYQDILLKYKAVINKNYSLLNKS